MNMTAHRLWKNCMEFGEKTYQNGPYPWYWCGRTAVHRLHITSEMLGYKISQNLGDCYQLLNVSKKSGVIEVKEAYFRLAKIYHPDSKSKQADANKFHQVELAYNTICQHMEKNQRHQKHEGFKGEISTEADGKCEFDIKHTAPQHRQYLEYDGIGFGTPSQRQKQHQTYRAAKAAEAVSTHRMCKIAVTDEKGLVLKDKRAARKIRTTNVIERLVEDLIQDSMARGEFDDLPGKGKPLPQKTYCPYMDLSTHTLNQVLVNNGYAPEWIQREKEIRNLLDDAKKSLLRERLKLGPEPLNDYNVKKWAGLLTEFEESIWGINKKINDFNLIVPIIRLQMVHLQPEWEITKVIKEYSKMAIRNEQMQQEQNNFSENSEIIKGQVAVTFKRVVGSISSLLEEMSRVLFHRVEK